MKRLLFAVLAFALPCVATLASPVGRATVEEGSSGDADRPPSIYVISIDVLGNHQAVAIAWPPFSPGPSYVENIESRPYIVLSTEKKGDVTTTRRELGHAQAGYRFTVTPLGLKNGRFQIAFGFLATHFAAPNDGVLREREPARVGFEVKGSIDVAPGETITLHAPDLSVQLVGGAPTIDTVSIRIEEQKH